MKWMLVAGACLAAGSLAYAQRSRDSRQPATASVQTRAQALSNGGARLAWALAEGLPDRNVDLEIENLPIREALERVLAAASLDVKHDALVDGDVPGDARVTLRAEGVRLSTALDLLADAAGGGWTVESRNGKRAVRIGRSVRRSNLALFGSTLRTDWTRHNALGSLTLVEPPTGAGYMLGVFTQDRRSTFTCPHCKGKATVIRRTAPARCPRCSRTLQDDWQFCPADGTKRPVPAGAWKYCPLCGKRVEADAAWQDAQAPTVAEALTPQPTLKVPAR